MVPDSAYLPDLLQIKFSAEAYRNFPSGNLPVAGKTGFGLPALDSVWKLYGFTSYRKLIDFPVRLGKQNLLPEETDVLRWVRIQLSTPKLLKPALEALEGLAPWIERVEPVYKIALHDNTEIPFFEAQWIPNDSLFSRQWHYHNLGQTGGTPDADIDLPEAWEIEKGHPSVIVGIMDNGIDTMNHDLRPSLSALRGYNFFSNQNGLVPGNHGSHTAGIIAARNNNISFVSGIAGGDGSEGSGVRLVSCQIFGVPNGSGGIENAFVWSGQNGVAISSNSWGYVQPGVFNQSALDAIDFFIENGGGSSLKNGLVIFSGGNSGDYSERWPGVYHKVIGVTATNHNDLRSWYSTFHEKLDIAAPGGELNTSSGGLVVNGGRQAVLSTIVQTTSGGAGYLQGTSMAAPHVSGVAALVASHGRGRVSADDVKSILLTQVDEIDGLQDVAYRKRMGTGRLNAFEALNLTRQLVMQPIVQPPQLFNASVQCNDINLSWQKFEPGDEVIIAVSKELNRGGLFGVPSGNYQAGDTLLGGGRIIYKGNASQFRFSQIEEGATYYFKIWSNRSGVYSMGIVPKNPVTIESSLVSIQVVVNCFEKADIFWQFATDCSNSDVLVAFSTINQFGDPTGLYQPGDLIGGATVIYAGNGQQFTHNHNSLVDSVTLFYKIWPIKQTGGYGKPLLFEAKTPAALRSSFPRNTGTSFVLAGWERNVCFEGDVLVAWNSTGDFSEPIGILEAGESLPGGDGTVLYKGAGASILHSNLLSNETYFYAVWPVFKELYGRPVFFSARTRCADEILFLPFRDTIGLQSLSGCNLDTVGFRNFTAGPLPQLKVVEAGVNPNTIPFAGGYMLQFNSYDTRERNEVWLTTKQLSSKGVESVDVAFKWYEDASDYTGDFFKPEGVTLQWSINYVNWNTVVKSPRITEFGKNGWKYKQVTLPLEAANQDALYVRWVFTSAWGFNCYIDEIAVIPTAPKMSDDNISRAVAQFKAPENSTHYYDADEKLLLSIMTGNNGMQHVDEGLELVVGGKPGAAEIDGSGNFIGNSGGWASIGKYWHIKTDSAFNSPAFVRQYVSDIDWQKLKQVATSSFNPFPAPSDSLPLLAYYLKGATLLQSDPATGHSGVSKSLIYGNTGFWQFDAGTQPDSLRYTLQPFISGWRIASHLLSQAGGGGLGAGSSAGNGALLPHWMAISTLRQQKQTQLTWTTGYEREWLLMQVERASATDNIFRDIGFISPAGWSQSGGTYTYTDAQMLPNGLYKFRVRATDKNGKQFVSPETRVEVADVKGILLYPNPADGGRVMVYGEGDMEWLRVIDGLGRVVYTAKPQATQYRLNLPFLASGIYYIQVSMRGVIQVQKLLIAR